MSVALGSLWLPILVAAVIVFIASSLVWTVIGWHNSDWKKLPDEEAARNALKGVPVGEYSVPYAAGNKDRASEEWQARYKEGPAVMLTVLPHGSLSMGKQLGQWFVYLLVVSLLIAYVAGSTLPGGTHYLKVFQVTGTVGVLAYSGNAAMQSIWFGHGWSRTFKDIVDGVIYGLLTAGVFGWLWPA
jgi:hypothetical protein